MYMICLQAKLSIFHSYKMSGYDVSKKISSLKLSTFLSFFSYSMSLWYIAVRIKRVILRKSGNGRPFQTSKNSSFGDEITSWNNIPHIVPRLHHLKIKYFYGHLHQNWPQIGASDGKRKTTNFFPNIKLGTSKNLYKM